MKIQFLTVLKSGKLEYHENEFFLQNGYDKKYNENINKALILGSTLATHDRRWLGRTIPSEEESPKSFLEFSYPLVAAIESQDSLKRESKRSWSEIHISGLPNENNYEASIRRAVECELTVLGDEGVIAAAIENGVKLSFYKDEKIFFHMSEKGEESSAVAGFALAKLKFKLTWLNREYPTPGTSAWSSFAEQYMALRSEELALRKRLSTKKKGEWFRAHLELCAHPEVGFGGASRSQVLRVVVDEKGTPSLVCKWAEEAFSDEDDVKVTEGLGMARLINERRWLGVRMPLYDFRDATWFNEFARPRIVAYLKEKTLRKKHGIKKLGMEIHASGAPPMNHQETLVWEAGSLALEKSNEELAPKATAYTSWYVSRYYNDLDQFWVDEHMNNEGFDSKIHDQWMAEDVGLDLLRFRRSYLNVPYPEMGSPEWPLFEARYLDLWTRENKARDYAFVESYRTKWLELHICVHEVNPEM